MKDSQFAKLLIRWYSLNKRDLPWRETRDPYKIWLSEVILQQTRVVQGLPYYLRFLEQYPTLEVLANASEHQILRLWQGLGYYSRARNLHACARHIYFDLNGKFPSHYRNLIKLPGIGDYTASAIASFAFHQKIPVVDGNVLRVLARVFGLHEDIASQKGRNQFIQLAKVLIPHQYTHLYNQALMDFGAVQCIPYNPKCDTCIFQDRCHAFAEGEQKSLPVKKKKIKVKERYFHYIVMQYRGKYLMKRRDEKDIWKGLYDFYLVEKNKCCSVDSLEEELLEKLLKQRGLLIKESEKYKHLLTHQRIFAYFLLFQVKSGALVNELLEKGNWGLFNETEIKELPKPVLIKNYFEKEILI